MGKHISHIKSNLTVESYVNKETGAVVNADYFTLLPSDEQSKYELTVSPKLPMPEQLANGEIAINYAAEYETISLKNNSSEIVSFKPETYNSEKYATNAYVQENLGDIIVNKDALNDLAGKAEDLLKLTDGDSADELAAMAGATGDNGVLVKKTEGDQVTWEVKNFAGTDKTVLKVGNVTIDSDNTGSTPIEIEGDNNLSVVGDSATDKITVGVAVNSDLASLISNTTNLTTLASKANELGNLADNSEDLTDLAGKVEQLDGLVLVSDVLEGIGAATGGDGVLVKTTDDQTTSWVYTDQLYDQGTTQDLNTGTDTSCKVWSANTLSEFVAESSASATKFKNGFNATTGAIDGGSDTLASIAEVVGDMYTVTTAGTFAGKNMEVGDSIVFKNAVAAGTAPTANDFVFIQGTVSVTNTGTTLDWNTDVTVATVEGVNITAKLPANPNTDRYVNSASFAYDSTSDNVKMTLTRAGSDSATVTGNIPKVSSSGAGVVPKGAAVTTQSQSTKFLREDGTWAAPSYTQSSGDVTGPSSSTDAHVAVFNGATGKVIKDSGFTIAKSVPSDAVFTDNNTTYTFANGTSSTGNGTFTVTPSGGSAQTVTVYNVQSKVAAKGSTTKPVYTSAAGTFAECSTYAGGTAVTLNGSSKAASTASFYAPTTAGTSGQILASNGSGAPSWTALSASNLPSNLVYSTLGTSTQVTSVPVTYGVVEASISSSPSQSVGLVNTSTVTVGSNIHLIVFNTGSSDVTLTIPHNPSTASGVFKYYNTVEMTTGANVVIPAGGVTEINFLFGSITGGTQNVYIRYA